MSGIVTKGTTLEILNLTTSSSDDIQVGFTNTVNSVIIKARTGVDLQIRSSRNAPHYYTLPSGDSLQLDVRGSTKDGNINALNIWIRSTSATPVAEIIGIYGG